MSTKSKTRDVKQAKKQEKDKDVKGGKKDKGKGKDEKGEKKDKDDKGGKKGKEKVKEVKLKPAVITLSVAIYRPIWGNLRHWALYLAPNNYIYQVIGDAMNFTANVTTNVLPSNSARFLESIEVGEIQPNDLSELQRIITETPVQNDVQGWCCQDYVMEALEELNSEQIVEDEEYERVRRRLLRRFNQ